MYLDIVWTMIGLVPRPFQVFFHGREIKSGNEATPFPVGGVSVAVVYYNRDYDRNGSIDIQVLRNVLPEKSSSRFHSVALQENSDVEIPCAVHWFVIYITTFISRTILALATYYIMQLKDGMGYKFR